MKADTPAYDSTTKTIYPILFAVCGGHFLNDLMQAVLPASYPLLKDSHDLTFSQIGLITFAFQITSSLLQPVVGIFTDKKPQPYSFTAGMIFAFSGLITLSFASNFITILLAACLIGMGSSIFHPEASRVAYYASGGRRGFAQSIFQLGGNGGSALGPLLIAFIAIPFGQYTIAFFALFAVLGGLILLKVSNWYKGYLSHSSFKKNAYNETPLGLSKERIITSIIILMLLIFSKYFFTASISNYYVFYLEEKFGLSETAGQMHLFLYLLAFTLGTLFGGPLGDRFGRKKIIWFSILGAAPFSLALPYIDSLFWTSFCIVCAGAILASAFSSILVYAQELLPGRIGMVSGLFYGFAFGMGGLGSAILGDIIDETSVTHVYYLCSYLPLIGMVTVFLPNIKKRRSLK